MEHMELNRIFGKIERIERNGRIYLFHRRYRFDPVTMAAIAVAAGTGMQAMGSIQEGKQAEQIGKYNASVLNQNAELAKKQSEEDAKIQGERGKRLLASQKAGFAAAGVKSNVGTPLVIEAQTKADIAKDMTWTLEHGTNEYNRLRSAAYMEKQIGKSKKRNSYWDAAATGVSGFGSLAFMANKSGGWSNLFGKGKTTGVTNAGLSRTLNPYSAGFEP